jgi:predicted esterase/catechol 2,3-dioxygenase-like lactoylglutathione lyase family enzyme
MTTSQKRGLDSTSLALSAPGAGIEPAGAEVGRAAQEQRDMSIDRISGVHHITAIASDPQRNVDFYVRVLGLRMVKRTVNFDDPGSYHLYYGDAVGSPGTILTFFPWPGAKRGVQGAGFQTATGFAVPAGSLGAWAARLERLGVRVLGRETRFGQEVLRFEDHDGMGLELIETSAGAAMPAWRDGPVGPEMAIRGFHSATLTVRQLGPTARLLTEHFGFVHGGLEAGRTRFVAAGGDGDGALGQIVDVVEDATAPMGKLGAGVVHHLALRARDDAEQGRWQARVGAAGFGVTEVRDRNYFRSIYFRERGGVLLEIATDGPGFTADEPAAALGMGLKLPGQYESARRRIEETLRPISVPVFRDGQEDAALALHLHRYDARPAEGGAARRTLVLLHGTGGDERDLLPLGRLIDPEANLLSPLGNVREGGDHGGGGQARFFRRLAEGVFDQEDLRVRTSEVGRWLAAAMQRYAIGDDAGAGGAGVTIVGFSNGANTAAAMLLRGGPAMAGGVRRGVLIRPMVTFEARAGETIADLRGVELLLISGADDPIVPVENARRLASQLREAGATVRHEVLASPIGHNLTQRDVELAREFVVGGK